MKVIKLQKISCNSNICKCFRVSWFYNHSAIIEHWDPIEENNILYWKNFISEKTVLDLVYLLAKKFHFTCCAFAMNLYLLFTVLEHRTSSNKYIFCRGNADGYCWGGRKNKNPRQLQLSSRSKHPVQFQFHITILEKTKFSQENQLLLLHFKN